jgi:hypothetical protein
MYKINHDDATVSKPSHRARQVPIQISSDDARQGDTAPNTLHVLGFGLVGAILANALIFVFYTWF